MLMLLKSFIMTMVREVMSAKFTVTVWQQVVKIEKEIYSRNIYNWVCLFGNYNTRVAKKEMCLCYK